MALKTVHRLIQCDPLRDKVVDLLVSQSFPPIFFTFAISVIEGWQKYRDYYRLTFIMYAVINKA